LAPALNDQTFLSQTPDAAIQQIIAGGRLRHVDAGVGRLSHRGRHRGDHGVPAQHGGHGARNGRAVRPHSFRETGSDAKAQRRSGAQRGCHRKLCVSLHLCAFASKLQNTPINRDQAAPSVRLPAARPHLDDLLAQFIFAFTRRTLTLIQRKIKPGTVVGVIGGFPAPGREK
jgi:hypothetical protein